MHRAAARDLYVVAALSCGFPLGANNQKQRISLVLDGDVDIGLRTQLLHDADLPWNPLTGQLKMLRADSNCVGSRWASSEFLGHFFIEGEGESSNLDPICPAGLSFNKIHRW